MTYRAYAGYAWFTFWVAVRAALNCHKLVGNLHGAIDFGNKLLAHKKFGLAYGALYWLHVRSLFFAGLCKLAVCVHYSNCRKQRDDYN